jgi:asparagine N-glycosylation enzyme membrane subunit Stt3
MTSEPRQAMEPAATAQTGNVFITKRLRLAGMFIIAGVLVQGLSLVWNNPLSFLAFIGIGVLVMFLGIVIYLTALVSPQRP